MIKKRVIAILWLIPTLAVIFLGTLIFIYLKIKMDDRAASGFVTGIATTLILFVGIQAIILLWIAPRK